MSISTLRIINRQVNHILDNPRFNDFPKNILVPYYETLSLYFNNYINFIFKQEPFKQAIRTYIAQTTEDINRLLESDKYHQNFHSYIVQSKKDENIPAEVLLFTKDDNIIRKTLEDLHIAFIDEHDNLFTHPTKFNFTTIPR